MMIQKSAPTLSRVGIVIGSAIFVCAIVCETIAFCVDKAIDQLYFQPIYGPNGKIVQITKKLEELNTDDRTKAQP